MEATLTKVTLPTAVLQDLVAKAAKGSTNVDIIPLSCLMQLKVENKVLSVKTTNNVNFVTVTSNVEADDFEIVVQTKLFSALVAKLASKETSIIVDGNKITVIADGGKYNIPLALDTDGSKIEFPTPVYTPIGGSKQITGEQIRSVLGINKACKAEMKEIPAIYNYYFDNDRVITTNVFKGCSNPVVAFESPVVLPPDLVELVTAVADENGVTVSQSEDAVEFSSSVGTVYGKKCTPADLEAFPAEQLVKAFSSPMAYGAKVNRSVFANAVDRICLFTDQLESNKLEVTFNGTNIHLYSAKTDSHEDISYLTAPQNLPEAVTIPVDGKMLAQELAVLDKEDISIKFDAVTGIQFVLGDLVVMLSVLEDAE